MFLTRPKFKFEFKKDKMKYWTLKSDLVYQDKNRIITIVHKSDYETPFMTDIATIPYGLQWLFKPAGRYKYAAVLHDYLYTQRYTSRLSDDITFFKAMRSEKVNLITSVLFFVAVRLFGGGNKA